MEMFKIDLMIKIRVYSPQLDEVFEIKEIKGNAIYTEEGAVLSKKLVKDYKPDPVEIAKRVYEDGPY